MAAVRIQLKSFPGETQDTAVDRVRAIVKEMQAQMTSSEELTQ
jgi:ribosomal protein S10